MDSLPAEVALAVLDVEDMFTGPTAKPAFDVPWRLDSACPPPPVPYHLGLPAFMTAPQPGLPATVVRPLAVPPPPLAVPPPPPQPPCMPGRWCRPVLSTGFSATCRPLQSLMAEGKESPRGSETSTQEPLSSRSSSSGEEEEVAKPPPGLELPSMGSALHGRGECQPCAWVHKAVGCRSGKACEFCHACPAGTAKARKKRARALAEEAAAAAAAEVKA